MTKIATWNINSVRLRIQLVIDFLNESQTDVLCLQETKTEDQHFPAEALAEAGWAFHAFRGEKSYNGVAIISHNEEFTDSVCTQKWIMTKHEVTGAGRLREEGEIKLDEEIEKTDGPNEVYDESGNKIVVKKAMTDPKEIKKAIKEIEKKISANKKNPTLTDEEGWEIADKLAELKAALEAQKA